MAKIKAETQGVDNEFKYTGSYDSVEFGEVTVAKARKLMRELPDQGGIRREFLKGKGDLCPPAIHLTFYKTVKKGLFRKKEVEEPVDLTLLGGHETGEVGVYSSGWSFGDVDASKYIVSFSDADEIIRDFFDTAAQEPAFPSGL